MPVLFLSHSACVVALVLKPRFCCRRVAMQLASPHTEMESPHKVHEECAETARRLVCCQSCAGSRWRAGRSGNSHLPHTGSRSASCRVSFTGPPSKQRPHHHYKHMLAAAPRCRATTPIASYSILYSIELPVSALSHPVPAAGRRNRQPRLPSPRQSLQQRRKKLRQNLRQKLQSRSQPPWKPPQRPCKLQQPSRTR